MLCCIHLILPTPASSAASPAPSHTIIMHTTAATHKACCSHVVSAARQPPRCCLLVHEPQRQYHQQQQQQHLIIPAAFPPHATQDRALHRPRVLVAAAAGGGGAQQQQQSDGSSSSSSGQRQSLFKQQQSQQAAAAADAQQQEQEEAEEAEDELEEGDEWEYAEGDEGEWEEDEWEDEDEADEADDDAFVAPATRQIPQSATTTEFTQDDFVEVGLISRPHGVRGEVKVQLITDEPKKRLGTAGKRLWLQALPVRSGLVPPSAAAARSQGGSAGAAIANNPFKTLQRVVVQSGRVARPGAKGQREEWAVKFEGFNSREQAASLAGNKLLLALCDREARPRGRDEFFIDQLVGCKALDASSSILVGIVTEVYDNGASYSLLRIRLAPEEPDIAASKYRSVLVPFVSEIVPTVDVTAGEIGLTLPEGLLETASTTKLRKAYTPEQQAQLRQQLRKRQEQLREWEQQQKQSQGETQT